jgi:Tfp pilus assembly protein FimT
MNNVKISFSKRTMRGFTLIEMVLYVSLCSIILFSLSMFLSFLLSARVKSQTINEVNQQGFQIMHLITQTIRNSRSVEVPGVGATSSSLSVTTGNMLLNPTVFRASGTLLVTQEASQQVSPLTNSRVKVSDLVFQNISSSSSLDRIVRVRFTLDYNNSGSTTKQEYSFTRTFSGSATLRR